MSQPLRVFGANALVRCFGGAIEDGGDLKCAKKIASAAYVRSDDFSMLLNLLDLETEIALNASGNAGEFPGGMKNAWEMLDFFMADNGT